MRFHPLPYGFAQRLDVGRAGSPEIDQEVAMKLRHLRASNGESTATRIVHEFPGTVSRRVLERRTAGAISWLARLAFFLDGAHFCDDLLRCAGTALKDRRCKDHIVRHTAVAIGKAHLAVAESQKIALSIDAPRLDANVLGLTSIGAPIHPQRTTDGSGNAA